MGRGGRWRWSEGSGIILPENYNFVRKENQIMPYDVFKSNESVFN